MENIQSTIQQIAESNLKDESYFIAEVVVSSSKGPAKVSILLDSDQGVTIDDCAELSRSVGNIMEEREILDAKYTLEVSSPGVDHPLSLVRQYKKNQGRMLKITTSDGAELKGKLLEASDDSIVIEKETKKGKKVAEEPITLAYSDIKKAVVQVSFK